MPVSPCQELRQLLIDELGYDPTKGDDHASEAETSHVSTSPDDNVPPDASNNDDEVNSMDFEQANIDDERVKDLLNLVDEKIDKENSGI